MSTVPVATDFPSAAGRRFGAIVESLGTTPVQIVVERAMYSDAGAEVWAAGTNAVTLGCPDSTSCHLNVDTVAVTTSRAPGPTAAGTRPS